MCFRREHGAVVRRGGRGDRGGGSRWPVHRLPPEAACAAERHRPARLSGGEGGRTGWAIPRLHGHEGKQKFNYLIIIFIIIIKLYYRLAVHIRRHIWQLSKSKKNTTLQR